MLSGIRLKQKVAPATKLLRAIADPTRVAIVYLLMSDAMELGDIVHSVGKSAPLVSHHLKVLLSAGWITKTKYGKLVTYYLSEHACKEVSQWLQKGIS